ncbi:probable serine/threonine-protein kinase PBL11 [Impatiens glandulifera]|uniref:probable serine/threonine-protein kinase PBL11 n=1 Tax=Impatiens glandulifera TaxID=253017 RepID=UPI001FB12ABB|nr:probable serine/threonine-protein kinase PBL11 [Impatiens glandulifera]
MLRHERLVHPCIPKLYGYCRDKNHPPAVVYNIKSLDSLFNLIPRGDFTWVQRINVAFAFACLLKFLQARLGDLDPFVIRNLAAEHVLLDEKYNPKLVDFSMITGGIFPNRQVYSFQPYGSRVNRDPDLLFQDSPAHIATWTKKSDVYAFGVMLLSLVSKKITTDEMRLMGEISVSEWEHEKYELCESLVHESLQADPCFYDVDGKKLSMIGVLCTSYKCQDRPSMKEVVNKLLHLRVLQNQKELLIKKLHPYFSFYTWNNKKPINDMKYRDTKIGTHIYSLIFFNQ